MSYKATAWAYDLPLKNPAKPILVALADFADEAGSCYPGQDKLAEMTGCSVRTVRRAIEYLEGLGLLSRQARYDQRGHRTSDRYYLNLGAQLLPDTLTAGHTDRRSDSPSLPDTLSIPTGHTDRVTISGSTSDPSGFFFAHEDEPEPPTKPFDLFWAAYPRHVGKRAAETAFGHAMKRAAATEILAGTARFRDDPNRTDEFTPHPTTWLNQDRWNDDPLPARGGNNRPPARESSLDRRDRQVEEMFRDLNGHGSNQLAIGGRQ